MDSWVAGMRVGWGSKGVHSDVLSLVEHSCSSSYHSFYLNPYPVYKYCFILVQNEVYSFISWIVAKYSHQQDGWSAACVWESTGLCMCSKLWGLTAVIFSFWAALWVGPKELWKDFSVFVYWWGKGSSDKGFVCLFHQQNQQNHELNPMLPYLGRMALKCDLKPCPLSTGTGAHAEPACAEALFGWRVPSRSRTQEHRDATCASGPNFASVEKPFLLQILIWESHMLARVNITQQVQWQWNGYGLLASAHQTSAALDTQMLFVT